MGYPGRTFPVRFEAEDVVNRVSRINWDYAIIQRVNPEDLSSKLLWLSPRKAILEYDAASNLELQPGDIVTIFSQRDISVPQMDRSPYVIVEGESCGRVFTSSKRMSLCTPFCAALAGLLQTPTSTERS